MDRLRRASWLPPVAATCLLIALAAGVWSALYLHWRDPIYRPTYWIMDIQRAVLVVALGLLAIKLRRWWWKAPFIVFAVFQMLVVNDPTGWEITDVSVRAQVRHAVYHELYERLYDSYAVLTMIAALICIILPRRSTGASRAHVND